MSEDCEHQPAAVTRPPATQLGISLVDTPDGQRLAVTMTMLLPAGDAKSYAAAATHAAAAMSTAGLVVANGMLAKPG